MTRKELLEILEEEIVGDGQGFPEQSEREAAADRIWPELEKLQKQITELEKEYWIESERERWRPWRQKVWITSAHGRLGPFPTPRAALDFLGQILRITA